MQSQLHMSFGQVCRASVLSSCPWLAVQGSHMLKLPKMCPPNAARVFYECTKPKPEDRPDIHCVVDWLREEDE